MLFIVHDGAAVAGILQARAYWNFSCSWWPRRNGGINILPSFAFICFSALLFYPSTKDQIIHLTGHTNVHWRKLIINIQYHQMVTGLKRSHCMKHDFHLKEADAKHPGLPTGGSNWRLRVEWKIMHPWPGLMILPGSQKPNQPKGPAYLLNHYHQRLAANNP